MQWRLLIRRGPQKSFTIVGDIAQASAASASPSWDGALSQFARDSWRLEELTVNYRTPAQIAEAAESMAIAHGLTITRSTAVRAGDWPVEIHETADIAGTVLAIVEADSELPVVGTIVVIASASIVDEVSIGLRAELGDRVGRGALGLTRPIAVLTPQESKGLEFDSAIVVEPQRIVDEITRGAAALYVSMTRPTQRLHLVTTGAVPEGIPRA